MAVTFEMDNILSLAGAAEKPDKQHCGYTILFMDESEYITDATELEIFPGVNLLFLFSDDEDQHIEAAFSMHSIKKIEARYE